MSEERIQGVGSRKPGLPEIIKDSEKDRVSWALKGSRFASSEPAGIEMMKGWTC